MTYPGGTRLVSALICGSLVLGACAGDDDGPASSSGSAQGSTQVELPRQDPELVSVGSPGHAVERYLRYLRLGAVPAAVAEYDATVRTQVGVPSLAGAMFDQQYVLRGASSPVVLTAENTEVGTLLTTVARHRDGAALRASFVLRRVPGEGWRLVYDTLMASALPGFETTRVQNRVDPDADTPGGAALAAGASVAERYRTALFTENGALR